MWEYAVLFPLINDTHHAVGRQCLCCLEQQSNVMLTELTKRRNSAVEKWCPSSSRCELLCGKSPVWIAYIVISNVARQPCRHNNRMRPKIRWSPSQNCVWTPRINLHAMASCWVCWVGRGRGWKVVLGCPNVGAATMVVRVKVWEFLVRHLDFWPMWTSQRPISPKIPVTFEISLYNIIY